MPLQKILIPLVLIAAGDLFAQPASELLPTEVVRNLTKRLEVISLEKRSARSQEFELYLTLRNKSKIGIAYLAISEKPYSLRGLDFLAATTNAALVDGLAPGATETIQLSMPENLAGLNQIQVLASIGLDGSGDGSDEIVKQQLATWKGEAYQTTFIQALTKDLEADSSDPMIDATIGRIRNLSDSVVPTSDHLPASWLEESKAVADRVTFGFHAGLHQAKEDALHRVQVARTLSGNSRVQFAKAISGVYTHKLTRLTRTIRTLEKKDQ